jgi:predicted nucleic acid-binding Zn ribbon protein
MSSEDSEKVYCDECTRDITDCQKFRDKYSVTCIPCRAKIRVESEATNE